MIVHNAAGAVGTVHRMDTTAAVVAVVMCAMMSLMCVGIFQRCYEYAVSDPAPDPESLTWSEKQKLGIQPV